MNVLCFFAAIALFQGVLTAAGNAQTAAPATATGVSRAANPAISANGLFLGAWSSVEEEGHEEEEGHGHGGEIATGLSVEEVEVQFTSYVDPYVKADLILSLPGGEGIELEEGFIATVGLPYNLALKAGKFNAEVGRHNLLHAHQFPFVDAPLVSTRLLGEEGLNEAGVGLSALLPLPWYAEASGQILDGESQLFASPEGKDLLYTAHLKNFWDLGEASTLELGGSAATGRNQAEKRTWLAGGDLTFKWRPLRQARQRGLVLQAEYLYARQDLGPEKRAEGGLYALCQYQFARRWWAQGRYDLFGLPRAQERLYRLSGLLAFVPSEFAALRLQYDLGADEGERSHRLVAQYNFTIGSHPAHRY